MRDQRRNDSMIGKDVLFRNEPFMARVVGRGDQPVQCTPMICDQPSACGVGILFEDGSGFFWGLCAPRNIIAAWRATHILRCLEVIESGTLCETWYAGLREPHQSDVESYVLPIIKKIGQERYDEIMAMAVPDEIVQLILEGQSSRPCKPALWPIVDEVRVGTIAWRKEFADSGLKHPDQIDAEAKAEAELIAKHELLLASFAKSQGWPRDCIGMSGVESAVIVLLGKGLLEKQRIEVVIALAGVMSDLVSPGKMIVNMFSGTSNPETFKQRLLDQRRQAIEKSAKWLMFRLGDSWWRFWRMSRWYSFAVTLLTQLLDEQLPFPSAAEKEESRT